MVFFSRRVGSWLKEATYGFGACVTGFPRSVVSVALPNATPVNGFPGPSHLPTQPQVFGHQGGCGGVQ